jgi:hypothetical protein
MNERSEVSLRLASCVVKYVSFLRNSRVFAATPPRKTA